MKNLDGFIPPAALQMFVENAIKHNEHTATRKQGAQNKIWTENGAVPARPQSHAEYPWQDGTNNNG